MIPNSRGIGNTTAVVLWSYMAIVRALGEEASPLVLPVGRLARRLRPSCSPWEDSRGGSAPRAPRGKIREEAPPLALPAGGAARPRTPCNICTLVGNARCHAHAYRVDFLCPAVLLLREACALDAGVEVGSFAGGGPGVAGAKRPGKKRGQGRSAPGESGSAGARRSPHRRRKAAQSLYDLPKTC